MCGRTLFSHSPKPRGWQEQTFKTLITRSRFFVVDESQGYDHEYIDFQTMTNTKTMTDIVEKIKGLLRLSENMNNLVGQKMTETFPRASSGHLSCTW